jgi:hypothetical protein
VHGTPAEAPIALVGFLGMRPCLLERCGWAGIIGRASFVSYLAQQWLIDFIPLWSGFDSWLTAATAPLYLALTAVVTFWIAKLWGCRSANRFMTLGLNQQLTSTPDARVDHVTTRATCRETWLRPSMGRHAPHMAFFTCASR